MSRDRLRGALLARCREVKIEPPTPGQIERLLGAAESMFERTSPRRPWSACRPRSVGRLEELTRHAATRTPGAGVSAATVAFLQELKEDPGPIQLDTLLAEIVKLERVKAIELPDGLFEGVSEKVVAGWRARAMKMYPSDFEASPRRRSGSRCWPRCARCGRPS